MGDRVDKINYYLDIADHVSKRSTCLRIRYGAVIVNNDMIISTGYNGAPRGSVNCSDLGYCERISKNIPHGEKYETCRSVHAEANAIIAAARRDMIGGTIFLSGFSVVDNKIIKAYPCMMCKRMIINAGLQTAICRTEHGKYYIFSVEDWIDTCS